MPRLIEAQQPTVLSPPRRIALLQSDNEILHTPHSDLRAILKRVETWDVDLFTEHSIDALRAQIADYDGVVIAEDALIHDSDAWRQLPELTSINVVLLRQRDLDAMEAVGLTGLNIRATDVPDPSLQFTGSRDSAHRVVAHWPFDVETLDDWAQQLQPQRVAHVLDGSNAAIWAPVLTCREGAQTHSVLAINFGTAGARSVVLSMTLRCEREAAARLLLNCIWFAVNGPPELVILRSADQEDLKHLATKCRIQGVRAVEVIPDSPASFDLGQWPMCAASTLVGLRSSIDAVASETRADPERLRQWLRRGGRIISIDDAGEVTTRYGVSDPHWIAREWSTWLTCIGPANWLGDSDHQRGSILRTLWVLRVLEYIRDPNTLPIADQLPMPDECTMRRRVAELVVNRVAPNGSIDNEIGISCAAHEILQLSAPHKRAVNSISRGIEEWLCRNFDSSSPRDKVAIACRLRDPKLILDAYEALSNSGDIDPVSAARLRVAAARLRNPSADSLLETHDPQLRYSPLLAGEYLVRVCEYSLEAVGPEEVTEARQVNFDNATYALARSGLLSGDIQLSDRLDVADMVTICAETLALLHLHARGSFPFLPISEHRDPDGTRVEQLLRTAQDLRNQISESQGIISTIHQQLDQREQSLRVAAHLVSGLTVAFLIGVVAVIWLFLLADQDIALRIGVCVVISVMLTLAVVPALKSRGLSAPWMRPLLQVMAHGRGALRDVIDPPDTA